jgi:hypothetical protein
MRLASLRSPVHQLYLGDVLDKIREGLSFSVISSHDELNDHHLRSSCSRSISGRHLALQK